ncbi:MAG TPA: 50S ribosomal protein L15 [Kiloniellales bacterium]|nr:50S ribosomal protein L15 [Kiloniellales bacterium]
MRLNDLSDNPGARHSSKRLGRGIGSGKGKTAGRGVKGQKARVGVAVKGFEGGQMPMHRRLPKRGFNQPNRARLVELSLDRLQRAIDAGKLDAGRKIDAAALKAAGLFKNTRDGVRLLAKGELKAKCDLVLAGATARAASAVEQAGGTLAVLEKKVYEPVSARGKARRTQPKTKKKAAAEE